RSEDHGNARTRAKTADGEATELQGLRELVRKGGVRGGGVRLVERGRAGAAGQIRDEHPETRRERGEPRAEVLTRPRPAMEQKERLARPRLAVRVTAAPERDLPQLARDRAPIDRRHAVQSAGWSLGRS